MFKKGDKVKCVEPVDELVLGKVYTVAHNDRTFIYPKEASAGRGWFANRFQLVERPDEKAKNNVTPKQLKRGSLYKILRNKQRAVIARYRNPAFGDTLTFTIHDRPIFVKKQNVMVATKEEVQEYLKGSK